MYGLTVANIGYLKGPDRGGVSSSLLEASLLPCSLGLIYPMKSSRYSSSYQQGVWAIVAEGSLLGTKYLDAGLRLYFPSSQFMNFFLRSGIKMVELGSASLSGSSLGASGTGETATMFYATAGIGLMSMTRLGY